MFVSSVAGDEQNCRAPDLRICSGAWEKLVPHEVRRTPERNRTAAECCQTESARYLVPPAKDSSPPRPFAPPYSATAVMPPGKPR